jgi:hypothetical protein
MDESTNSISPNERDLWSPASDRKSAIVDASPPDLARARKLGALGGQSHSDQIKPCTDDLPSRASVVVYCGNEEEVSRGFLIALRAMGVAVVEQPPEPAKPPVARAKL